MTPASPSALFTGQAGHIYGFYSVATDNAGNVQATPATAQQTVQILPPVTVTSIAAITPNPRNTPVSTVAVTFSIAGQPQHVRHRLVTLTDNSDPIAITSAVTLSLVSGSTYRHQRPGWADHGRRDLQPDRQRGRHPDTYGNPGTGSLSTSWLMDTTPPTSTVNSLPAQTTSTSFTVSVTSSDPTGSNGSTPSGVASIAIYDSKDGGAFTLFATVTPASPSAFFTGQAGHTYGFYSIATDNAGNVQATPTAAQQTVQILSPLSCHSIASVSPNPAQHAGLERSTSRSASRSTSARSPIRHLAHADRQRRTQPDHERRHDHTRLGSTYQINGLAGLTTNDGNYTLSR